MEIKDARYIEIFRTLEKIERLNKAIHFHRVIERTAAHRDHEGER